MSRMEVVVTFDECKRLLGDDDDDDDKKLFDKKLTLDLQFQILQIQIYRQMLST